MTSVGIRAISDDDGLRVGAVSKVRGALRIDRGQTHRVDQLTAGADDVACDGASEALMDVVYIVPNASEAG